MTKRFDVKGFVESHEMVTKENAKKEMAILVFYNNGNDVEIQESIIEKIEEMNEKQIRIYYTVGGNRHRNKVLKRKSYYEGSPLIKNGKIDWEDGEHSEIYLPE